MSKPTINDVAALAGVSKKTVSRVINNSPLLNEGTRAKVQAVIAQLGYVPNPQARALATGRNLLIALIHDQAGAPLAFAVQQAVLGALQGTDHALLVRALDRRAPGAEQELRRFLETHRPAGVLLLPGVAEREAIVRACRELGCNHVRMAASALDAEAQLVASADRAAAAAAVGHLIALGHRRIGLVAGPEEAGAAQERELGYLDAMADHDLDRGPALIASGDYGFASGEAAGRLLLEVSPRPSAIFAVTDEMAAGVLHAARARKIAVPAELSILGFEDTAIAAQLFPPLTTVRVPLADMARAATFKLIYPEAAASQPTHFTPELVARASAGPVQAG
jgi:LacI family transcriptional regulator